MLRIEAALLIPGDGEPIRPGMPYPEFEFGQQYWDTPATTKHGFIVSLTKEAIFFDRTALVMRRAGEAGYAYLLVLMMAVILTISLTAVTASVLTQGRRDREIGWRCRQRAVARRAS